MAKITLKGNEIHTIGDLPKNGSKAVAFTLVKKDLSEVGLDQYPGKKKLLNIFPSIDTGTCALALKSFFGKLATMDDVQLLNISKDTPFAFSRFTAENKMENAETLSAFRSSFASDYQLEIADGPLKGLCSRAVIVLDKDNTVIYSEQVSEITAEPNYEAALQALRA